MTAIIAGAGGAVAIALMELLSERAAFPLMLVPFATSIVLVTGSPEIEAAQPRPLIGRHVVATVVGLLVVKIAGPGAFTAALAVGLATGAMHLTKTFHPPAGIDPLVVVLNDMSWSFLFAPVAGRGCPLGPLAFVLRDPFRAHRLPRACGGGGPSERLLGLFRCRFERGLTQPAELAIALEHETAAVERGERRAVADGHDRGAFEPRVEKAIERGFRRLVERSRGFVEEKII